MNEKRVNCVIRSQHTLKKYQTYKPNLNGMKKARTNDETKIKTVIESCE